MRCSLSLACCGVFGAGAGFHNWKNRENIYFTRRMCATNFYWNGRKRSLLYTESTGGMLYACPWDKAVFAGVGMDTSKLALFGVRSWLLAFR